MTISNKSAMPVAFYCPCNFITARNTFIIYRVCICIVIKASTMLCQESVRHNYLLSLSCSSTMKQHFFKCSSKNSEKNKSFQYFLHVIYFVTIWLQLKTDKILYFYLFVWLQLQFWCILFINMSNLHITYEGEPEIDRLFLWAVNANYLKDTLNDLSEVNKVTICPSPSFHWPC